MDGGGSNLGTLVLLMSELCLRNFEGQTSVDANWRHYDVPPITRDNQSCDMKCLDFI